MAFEDLTEFETRLFEWIRQSDFEEVNDALAALTSKVAANIYVHYNDGAIRITAER